ncbi:hypothetical protein MAUB1S_05802 [Mycolicibacterium aubagnense]
MTKDEVAKDYLDFLRTALTVFTWTALCGAVTVFAWSPEILEYGVLARLLAAIVTFVALTTTIGGAYSLLLSAYALRKKIIRHAPWAILMPVAFFGPVALWLFGLAAVSIFLVPMLKNIAQY